MQPANAVGMRDERSPFFEAGRIAHHAAFQLRPELQINLFSQGPDQANQATNVFSVFSVH
jgi:hypothetical protein